MTMHPDDFPRWQADIAKRRVDPASHREAVVRTLHWQVGPMATAAILARSAAYGTGLGRAAAANDSAAPDRLAA